jgi:hypothetical protein
MVRTRTGAISTTTSRPARDFAAIRGMTGAITSIDGLPRRSHAACHSWLVVVLALISPKADSENIHYCIIFLPDSSCAGVPSSVSWRSMDATSPSHSWRLPGTLSSARREQPLSLMSTASAETGRICARWLRLDALRDAVPPGGHHRLSPWPSWFRAALPSLRLAPRRGWKRAAV